MGCPGVWKRPRLHATEVEGLSEHPGGTDEVPPKFPAPSQTMTVGLSHWKPPKKALKSQCHRSWGDIPLEQAAQCKPHAQALQYLRYPEATAPSNQKPCLPQPKSGALGVTPSFGIPFPAPEKSPLGQERPAH